MKSGSCIWAGWEKNLRVPNSSSWRGCTVFISFVFLMMHRTGPVCVLVNCLEQPSGWEIWVWNDPCVLWIGPSHTTHSDPVTEETLSFARGSVPVCSASLPLSRITWPLPNSAASPVNTPHSLYSENTGLANVFTAPGTLCTDPSAWESPRLCVLGCLLLCLWVFPLQRAWQDHPN